MPFKILFFYSILVRFFFVLEISFLICTWFCLIPLSKHTFLSAHCSTVQNDILNVELLLGFSYHLQPGCFFRQTHESIEAITFAHEFYRTWCDKSGIYCICWAAVSHTGKILEKRFWLKKELFWPSIQHCFITFGCCIKLSDCQSIDLSARTICNWYRVFVQFESVHISQ